MKNNFHESEIRPRALFDQWKEILKKDLAVYFADKNKFVKVNCPGCGSKKFNPAFMKFGFEYRRCNSCGSLFVSPRPQDQALGEFYQTSRAVKFWERKVFKTSMGTRYRHQVYPLYVWFLDLIKDWQPKAKIALDYKPKYFSLFLLDKDFSKKFEKIFFAEPLAPKPNLLTKNVKIINSLGTPKEKVDVFTAFEVLDREFDPACFIQRASKICRRRALFLFTCNTISGFEYQVLGRNSSRLVPPDRLNLLSVEAIQKLLVNNGFKIIDLSTPGKLDVELVASTLQQNPNIEMPEFLRYMFKYRDEDTWESFQDFLQLSRLSSYLRVAAIKR